MADWYDEQGWRRPLAVSLGFVLIALMVMAGGKGVALAVCIAALASIPSLRSLSRLLPLEFPFALFLIFIAWAWVTSYWSPIQKGQALKMAAFLPFYTIFAWNVWSLRGRGRYLALVVATLSGLLIITGFSFEAITGLTARLFWPASDRIQIIPYLDRGTSALVAMLPALWAFLSMLVPDWRGKAAAVLSGALGFVLSWRFGLDAGMLASVLSAAAFGLGWLVPRTSILLTGLAGSAMVLLAPIYMNGITAILGAGRELPVTWQMRLSIWQFALDRISEKPLFGWGLDASRSFTKQIQIDGLPLSNISLHPHNVGLHVWLETGLVGVLLFSGVILLLAIRVSTAPNLTRAQGAAISACYVAFLVFASMTYGAWQEWFWGLFGWLAALCTLIGPEPEKGAAP